MIGHTSLDEGLAVPSYYYDGFQVHRAALARGLNTLALPRQVLLAGRTGAVPAEVSFTHGVPEASTVAAVTFAQDRRLRRALLERAGLPVPRGATFTWRSASKAGSWAEGIGFPVVVKETVGENPAKAIVGINSAEDLKSAFQVLRKRNPEDRAPGRNPEIAGYATTRLGFELDDEGNEVAPVRTRFLVEKQHQGTQVRLFAHGDEQLPIAVILDADAGRGVEDVSEHVHPSLYEVACRAVASVPGLAVGTVDVVLDDYRRPVTEQAFYIAEVAERVRAETYVAAEPELGDRIGDALLEYQARKAGLALPGKRAVIDVDLRIEGLRDASQLAAGFGAIAADFGLTGSVSVEDQLEGAVVGAVNGPPADVARMIESLMCGLVPTDRASCIEAKVRS
jgi:hypothetical protein